MPRGRAWRRHRSIREGFDVAQGPCDLERLPSFYDHECKGVSAFGRFESHRIELLLLLKDQELLLLGEFRSPLQTKLVQNRLELLIVLLNSGERATRLLSADIIRNDHRLGDEDTAEVFDKAVLQLGDGEVRTRRWDELRGRCRHRRRS